MSGDASVESEDEAEAQQNKEKTIEKKSTFTLREQNYEKNK